MSEFSALCQQTNPIIIFYNWKLKSNGSHVDLQICHFWFINIVKPVWFLGRDILKVLVSRVF